MSRLYVEFSAVAAVLIVTLLGCAVLTVLAAIGPSAFGEELVVSVEVVPGDNDAGLTEPGCLPFTECMPIEECIDFVYSLDLATDEATQSAIGAICLYEEDEDE